MFVDRIVESFFFCKTKNVFFFFIVVVFLYLILMISLRLRFISMRLKPSRGRRSNPLFHMLLVVPRVGFERNDVVILLQHQYSASR